MDGLPTTIRLIDPPLHEFLPDLTDLSVAVAIEDDHGHRGQQATLRLLDAVKRMHEQNPMLGLRGVRLGIAIPGLFTMQARAILEAAAERKKAGGDPQPEIMIPLVAAVQELELIKARDPRRRRGRGEGGRRPRLQGRHDDRAPACGDDRRRDRRARGVLLLRHQRPHADDLGLLARRRRGDVLRHLPRAGHLRGLPVRDPRPGRRRPAGAARGREGRTTRPDIHLGVCGEHGGDPDSIHFFDEVGLDYVSCSPFRVPVARLEAGRSNVSEQSDTA